MLYSVRCDAQSCDECHPNNNGYTYMATAMYGGLGLGDGCKATEYCCPDAKACLTPTSTSCASDSSACGAGQVCCPLTKICVVPGNPCATPCLDADTYCCPDAKACLKPTNPGVFCTADVACGAGEVCWYVPRRSVVSTSVFNFVRSKRKGFLPARLPTHLTPSLTVPPSQMGSDVCVTTTPSFPFCPQQ
jgi:hypothetical protein